ncbi:anaerobic ribonucleoside-triphosphate reductase activating protein [Papillibacter cinnamivorans]|uniref:Pyruvate formate lyase activating enzyme n=1 Tax=Papillibacter cinnamivorans DSM 12816 TaxID=1122930 RepID=A0A1W2BU73_9FIRM|nr:anaerobic ribonucleoside-triphosphate reductase activating protein [Papillibacter cinnamivorans]SMC76284.1 pyruvate formate lyase activating enzyme [Papillibacter cinnamivorans DSM 12816]
MNIAGIVKTTMVDFPGSTACILFVRGCNYNCFYCHNRAILSPSAPLLEDREIGAFLTSRAGLLEGVVISGGEPTLQPDLLPFLRKLKAMGYRVKLDTNGSSPGIVESLLKEAVCDYFAVDYKAPKGRYPEICGSGGAAEPVLRTVKLLLEDGVSFEVRTTVAPQLSEEDLLGMARELPPLPKYILNRYRPPEQYLPEDEDRVSARPYTRAELEALAAKIRAFQPNVIF